VFYCDPYREDHCKANSAVSPRVKLEPVSSRSRSSEEREATARVDAGAIAPNAHRTTAPAFTPVAGAVFIQVISIIPRLSGKCSKHNRVLHSVE
jgi:hypothetical protein